MTRLALGAKCGRTPAESSARASSINKLANAGAPMPVLSRPKKWRRVSDCNLSRRGSMCLFLGHGGVQIQDQTGDGGVRRELTGIQLCIARIFAGANQLQRRIAVGLIS